MWGGGGSGEEEGREREEGSLSMFGGFDFGGFDFGGLMFGRPGRQCGRRGWGRRKNQEFLPLRVPRRARGEGEGRGPRPPIPTNYIKKTRRWVEVDTPRSAVELVPRRGTFAGGGGKPNFGLHYYY